jgi:4-amino-4-deoxy-L-arabinose transferase-like glycosyltransferase
VKRLNNSIIFLIIILFIAVAFILLGINLPERSKLIPNIISSILIFLVIIQIFLETNPKYKGKDFGKLKLFVNSSKTLNDKVPYKEKRQDYNKDNKEFFRILIWILFLVLGIYFLGFFLILPIFLFLFYYIECHYKWIKALVVTFIFLAIIYLVFEQFLGIELYKGIVL